MSDRSRILLVVVVIGAMLGVFSHASSGLPGAWRWAGNFGALWVAISFLAGRLTKDVLAGACFGGIALVAASLMHYVPHRMASEGISLHAFRWPVVLWAGLGALLGLLFGALGSTHSRGIQIYSVVGTALLVATFVAEACVLYRTGHPNAVAVAVPIEVSIGVAIPFLLLRTLRQRTMALGALVFSPVAVLGLSAFMGVIHRVYPGID